MQITAIHLWAFVALCLVFFLVDALFLRWQPAFPLLENRSTGKALRPAWHIKYLVLVIVFFFSLIAIFNLTVTHNQQFSYLADAFLHGKLGFLEPPGDSGWYDTVAYNGEHYWPLGPFPAVVLIPFVFLGRLFGQLFLQGWLQLILTLGIFYSIHRIARHLNYSRYDASIWAFTFTFATAYLGVSILPWASLYAHVVVTFLLFWVLLEYTGQKRYWLIGILLAGALTTRLTAGLVVVYFLAEIVFIEKWTWNRKFRSVAQLLLPMVIGFALVSLYNYARFGSFSEIGYTLQEIPAFLNRTRAYGLFSLAHVPGNLYFFLINGPSAVMVGDGSQVLRFPFMQGDALGMSVFITSPVFLYLFMLRYPGRRPWLMFATALVVAIPVFLYYGVGFKQLGYRYALDFLPLVFFVLMQHYGPQKGHLSRGFRVLVVMSALLNLYWFITIFMPELMMVEPF
jgi:hypothetical protein